MTRPDLLPVVIRRTLISMLVSVIPLAHGSPTRAAAGEPVATSFVRDTFSDVEKTPLDDHLGEVGATWRKLPGFAGSGVISGGVLLASGIDYQRSQAYYASGQPRTAEYDIVYIFRTPKTAPIDASYGVIFRVDPVTGDHYRLQYDTFAQHRRWQLLKVVQGRTTPLGSYRQDLAAGTEYQVWVRVRNNSKAVTVRYENRNQPVISSADNSIATAGHVGLFAYGNEGGNGHAVNLIRATDLGRPEDYVLDPPARRRGVPGSTSGAFTVTLRRGSNPDKVTVTPAVSGLPGRFAPESVTLSGAASSATFTYTPSAGGAGLATIVTRNDRELADPAPVTYVCDYDPPPGLAAWESAMSFAANWPTTNTNSWMAGDDHYDAPRVLMNVRDYVSAHPGRPAWQGTAGAPASWDDNIERAVRRYRDHYLRPNGSAAAGYFAFNWGLASDFERNGHALSRETALVLARYSAFGERPDLFTYDGCEYSREWAFALLDQLRAEDMGRPPREMTHDYARVCLNVLDDLMKGYGRRKAGPKGACAAYLIGLDFQALTAYWDRYRDTHVKGIPAKIKKGLDYLWATYWNAATLTFPYADDPSVPVDYVTQALNPHIGPAYAWYYMYSARYLGARDATYRDRHDQIFRGSQPVVLGTFGTQKEYNECYRWSPQGLAWREQGDRAWAPATALMLSGPAPAVGRANAWSGRFKVSLAGARVAVASPVTVTPTDGGSGGSFMPASFRLTTDKPYAVFRYRPEAAAAGRPVTVAVADDGGLVILDPIAYLVSGTAPVATGYTLTGPASCPVGAESGPFTVALSPPGSVPPASADRFGGIVVVGVATSTTGSDTFRITGSAAPGPICRLWLSADTPSMEFRYLTVTAGKKRLTARSEGALPDPAPAVCAATPR